MKARRILISSAKVFVVVALAQIGTEVMATDGMDISWKALVVPAVATGLKAAWKALDLKAVVDDIIGG